MTAMSPGRRGLTWMGKRGAGDPHGSVDHLPDRDTPAISAVDNPHRSPRLVVQRLEDDAVDAGQIADVDIIADGGSILGLEVVAEDADAVPNAHDRLTDDPHQGGLG